MDFKKDAKLAALKEIVNLAKKAMSDDLRDSAPKEPDTEPDPADPEEAMEEEAEPSSDKAKLLALKEKFKK